MMQKSRSMKSSNNYDVESIVENYTPTALVVAANILIPEHPELVTIPAIIAGGISTAYSSYNLAKSLDLPFVDAVKYSAVQTFTRMYRDIVINGALAGNGFVYQTPVLILTELVRDDSRSKMKENIPFNFPTLDSFVSSQNWSMLDLEREG